MLFYMQARSNIIFGKRAYDRATVYCRLQERIVLVFGPEISLPDLD